MTKMFKHPGKFIPLERKDEGGALPLEVKKSLDLFTQTIEDFRKKNDQRLEEMKKGIDDAVTKAELEKINKAIDDSKAEVKKRFDEFELKAGRLALGQQSGKAKTPEQIEYSEKFEAYMRKGENAVGGEHALRDLERKATAATVDSDSAGGFTVRPEIDTAIDETTKEVSPIRQLCDVRQIGAGSYKKLVNQHGASSGWVGEKDTRPQTLAADLAELEFPVMELYAMPAATQTLLDDAVVNIDQWLADEVSLEFAQQEGKAFVTGDGVKKPRGFIGGYTTVADASYAWGKIGYSTTGQAGGFAASNPADCLVDLIFSLKKIYRDGASFLVNRKTMGVIRKLKDGQGNYIVDRALRDNALVEMIFGFPVTEAEDMPDIGANSLSIAFGNWKRGYLIVDRVGSRVLRDPYTAKPYVLFYTTKRVGGGVQNFEAIKLLKFA